MGNKFDILNEIDVGEYTDKKGQFTYLSWGYAVRELLKVAPDATWEIHEYEGSSERGVTKQPYMRTDTGYFVKVTVTVDGISRTQVHPVLDHRNKTVDEPNAFQINTSIQRCLAKAIALHGLGLYIFAGEDLPREPEPLTNKQRQEVISLLSEVDGFEEKGSVGSLIIEKIDSGEINETNFKATMNKIKRINDKVRKEMNNE